MLPEHLMQEILNQLGELVLGSVPTILLFLVLVVAYNFLVAKPLQKTLGERHKRTTGAMDEAKLAIAAAEAKAGEYERKLREARSAIFESRQARLKQWNNEREKAVQEARAAAQQRVATAREAVERSGEEARATLQGTAAQLSGRILETILSKKTAVQG